MPPSRAAVLNPGATPDPQSMSVKGTILVVDDTPANLRLLVDILAAEGYEVRPADSGELALASVAAHPPELILLDVHMPGMGGFEVCRQLRARAEGFDIPSVFLSAHVENAERIEAFKLGAVDFIANPFQREDLLARVHTHLEVRRLRRRLEQQADDLRQANQRLQRELAERQQLDEFQSFLAQTSSSPTIEPFFSTLARYLAVNLGMDFVCIDRLDGDGLTARTVAVWCDGSFQDNVTYALKDTPCGEVVGKSVCCFPASVCRFFPRDEVLRELRAESYVGVTLWSHTGQPIGLIAVIGRQRLSNRPLAEAALQLAAVRAAGELERQQAEERFRALAQSATDAIISIDREGTVCFWNPAATAMFGWGAPEMEGRRIETIIPQDYRQAHRHGLAQAAVTGASQVAGRLIELAALHKDGALIPVELSLSQWQTGEGVFFTAILRDIRERHRLEAEREKARGDYQLLFNKMIDGFALHEILCDETGRAVDYRFLAVNPAYERLTGLNAEKLLGRRVKEVLPQTEPFWIETYGRVALTGEPACFEHASQALDRSFEVNAFCPAPGRFACVFVDVTERKRAQAQLRELEAQFHQAQKMEAVGQLAGGVAHDFNNILAATIMNLSLLERDPHLPADLRGRIQELTHDAKRAANLTRQLLLFSRRQIAQHRVLDLNQVVDQLLSMLRRLLGEDIDLTFRPGGRSLWIEADPGMIEQVVMNLCVNARDAMPEGGRLTLSTQVVEVGTAQAARNPEARSGGFARLTVADHGCGMDAETLKRIFEPFFTTKGVGKGTGLGLATVYGIVKQHHGWVEVESQVGAGTIFRVYLLLSHKIAETPAETGDPARLLGGSETILLVEDEPSVRRTTAVFLKRLGYAVYEAANGVEALELWRQHGNRIELLLTDMVMPGGLTGLALAEQLRAQRPGLPVIISSGYSAALLERGGSADLGVIYAPKPCEPATLARTLRECLERKPNPSP